jgi:hypothetical protein
VAKCRQRSFCVLVVYWTQPGSISWQRPAPAEKVDPFAAPGLATARQKPAHSPLPTPCFGHSCQPLAGCQALMVPAHAGLERGRALSQPWVSHRQEVRHTASPLDAPSPGRTSGRPIRTPPASAPPLACGITVSRWACGIGPRSAWLGSWPWHFGDEQRLRVSLDVNAYSVYRPVCRDEYSVL